MVEFGSIVVGDMQARRLEAETRAHDVGNARTPGYEALVAHTIERPTGGVDLLIERDQSPGILEPSSDVSLSSSAAGRSSAGISSSDESSLAAPDGFVEGSDVDPVSETIGMQESANPMDLPAPVYQRADAALGSPFEAFG